MKSYQRLMSGVQFYIKNFISKYEKSKKPIIPKKIKFEFKKLRWLFTDLEEVQRYNKPKFEKVKELELIVTGVSLKIKHNSKMNQVKANIQQSVILNYQKIVMQVNYTFNEPINVFDAE